MLLRKRLPVSDTNPIRSGCLWGGLFAKEIVGGILILEGCRAAAFEDAVNVAQEEVAGLRHQPDLILNVHREIEIFGPVLPLVSVGRQYGIFKENLGAVEDGAEPVEHDDVGRDQQEIDRKVGTWLITAVKIKPDRKST